MKLLDEKNINDMMQGVVAVLKGEAQKEGLTWLSIMMDVTGSLNDNVEITWQIFAHVNGDMISVRSPSLEEAFREAVRRSLWEHQQRLLPINGPSEEGGGA